MVNTSYVTMAEHLLLYMLETHEKREKAEVELLQFLACLKYYTEKSWPRA